MKQVEQFSNRWGIILASLGMAIGAGNLWRSLNKAGNKTSAIARVNDMSTNEFYWFLTNRHIREETRNYLKKVNGKKTKYINL